MRHRQIAVVGAGMAAARFTAQLLARDPGAAVTLFGDEPHAPYNRALLADVLTGRYQADAIGLPAPEHPGVHVRTGVEVTAVDTAAHTLELADGSFAAYDTLVMATGSNPVLPPIRNLHCTSNTGEGGELKQGVHAFRTLEDCARLAEAVPGATRAVVVGGGILGVSAARALAALGLPVEIVHQAPYLMERHLDEEGGAALHRALAGLGVAVYPENRAKSVGGTDRAEGVVLANGYRLDADLVVLACGVRPRVGLARAAGLDVRTGIVVDDTLATSAPDVYAIGDCTEHAGLVHGLAGPAWEQADVLAAHLSGADAAYRGSRVFARLTAGPVEIAAFGEVDALPGTADVIRLADPTRGSYKKLVLRGDRLVGGILVGDLATVGALTHAYERDEPVPEDPLHLLITQGAPQ
ncbi:NAD(P)/FAD-dependent oxidoreductase [Yinghuangia seranimata]|uniref:NAD(P)/FAD-dependent oxidoreductase n=1 Tax=Yinghuangia seranimata TaxID=408067 RepID=UPI00248B16F7|nr:FAD-dependent oxidoreductase [Yinghuangia seranimata]MDI2132500.1 FAD-dependent oxidoreductase [Yinghuangia seranimata]